MKPLFPCVAVLLCPLLLDFARSDETAPNASAGEARPTGKAGSIGPSEATERQVTEASDEARRELGNAAFRAKIVTGDRSRDFDSPTRAWSELQRAAGLRRRSGKDDGPAFAAVLTVNGVEYEFSDPDDARTACRAVMEGLRRLARVRAALGDLGTIPEAAPADAAGAGQFRGTPEQALQTVRQRVNEALRQEVQRNQGRMPSQQRMQQIMADQVDRARRDGLFADTPSDSASPKAAAGAAVEARKQTEIEAVRELLARAFSAANADEESAAATVQAGEEQ